MRATRAVGLALSLLLTWALIGAKTGTIWDISTSPTTAQVLSHAFLVHTLTGSGDVISLRARVTMTESSRKSVCLNRMPLSPRSERPCLPLRLPRRVRP